LGKGELVGAKAVGVVKMSKKIMRESRKVVERNWPALQKKRQALGDCRTKKMIEGVGAFRNKGGGVQTGGGSREEERKKKERPLHKKKETASLQNQRRRGKGRPSKSHERQNIKQRGGRLKKSERGWGGGRTEFR